MSIKQAELTKRKEYLEQCTVALHNSQSLKIALEACQLEVISDLFFEEKFLEHIDDRIILRMSINRPINDYVRHNYEIKISQHHKIKLFSRTKEEILQAIEKKIEEIEGEITLFRKEIADIEKVDDTKLVQELQALYVKYGKPEILWSKILESAQVKYPY